MDAEGAHGEVLRVYVVVVVAHGDRLLEYVVATVQGERLRARVVVVVVVVVTGMIGSTLVSTSVVSK